MAGRYRSVQEHGDGMGDSFPVCVYLPEADYAVCNETDLTKKEGENTWN